MSAVYSKVAEQLGLNNSSQGDAGFLHALLTYANANHSGSDVATNPYSEVIRRLEAAGLNPHAMVRIKSILADGEIKFAAGRP